MQTGPYISCFTSFPYWCHLFRFFYSLKARIQGPSARILSSMVSGQQEWFIAELFLPGCRFIDVLMKHASLLCNILIRGQQEDLVVKALTTKPLGTSICNEKFNSSKLFSDFHVYVMVYKYTPQVCRKKERKRKKKRERFWKHFKGKFISRQ